MEASPVTDDCPPPNLASSPGIDTSVSHSARVWDYWLGGKDNYPVDRQVGDQIAAMLPDIVRHARADRMFLGRPCGSWPVRRGSGSSWTSAPDCRPWTTLMRWRSGSRRNAGSCMSTM